MDEDSEGRESRKYGKWMRERKECNRRLLLICMKRQEGVTRRESGDQLDSSHCVWYGDPGCGYEGKRVLPVTGPVSCHSRTPVILTQTPW